MLIICVALGMLVGCAAPPAQLEMKPAPQTPIAVKKEALGKPTWDPAWDRIVEKALPPEMLSASVARDVSPFCPRFNALSDGDKRAFWAYFFQALAGAEAGLTPTADVRGSGRATKDTVTHRMVRSEGLLQLAYMDAQRYDCDFDWEKDKLLPERDPARTILQPENNLTCGVQILYRQLIVKQQPLLSRSSYWSTLRPGRSAYRVFARQMTNVPAVCRHDPSLGDAKTAAARRAHAPHAARKPASGLK
ncbi:MAG: hypothetical protein ABSB30_04750 [Terracidiphilus sp.]